jgi:tetratricopeptide (TPR) repeat protein
VRFELHRGVLRLSLGGILLLLSAGLVFFAARRLAADRLASSPRWEDWERASRLEPDNAQYPFQLGLYWQNNLQQPDLERAAGWYRRAVEINPRLTDAWLRLASVHETLGEVEKASEAYRRARASWPISTDVAWQHGNFLIRQGQPGEGARELRRAVENDPQLMLPAMQLCWRASGDAALVLDVLLPKEQRFYAAALHFFAVARELEAARAAWQRLVQLGQPLELPAANPLIEVLIEQRRGGEIAAVWREVQERAGESPAAGGVRPLVWDGGFERGWQDISLGWRLTQAGGGAISIAPGEGRSGSQAVKIQFDGSANPNFEHLNQFVPVQPSTHYFLEAFVRTEELSSDEGIYLLVHDPWNSGAVRAATSKLAGTQPWTRLSASVRTSAQTALLRIIVRRDPSQRGGSRLRGTVWVDDVSLAPASGDTTQNRK